MIRLGVMAIVVGGVIIIGEREALAPQYTEEIYYFHGDHLDFTNKMTDESGAVVWSAF